MKQNWGKSVYYKQNHFVFKLAISILLVGFAFRLLFSQSSNVNPNVTDDNININTPVVENGVKPIPSDLVESPKELNQFQPKGTFFLSGFFLYHETESRFELFSHIDLQLHVFLLKTVFLCDKLSTFLFNLLHICHFCC